MVNSGTEAVMSAKREKIIKFAGCYHGHADSMLVKVGSGAMTNGIPNSGGVTAGAAKDTLIARYILFEQNKGNIAAVIVEPVAANMGVVPPKDNFLEELRKLCDKEEALLIFDEVITADLECPWALMEEGEKSWNVWRRWEMYIRQGHCREIPLPCRRELPH